MLAFGPWSPDLPAYGGTHSTEAFNVIPLTGMSYGPLRQLAPVSAQITYDALGMTAAPTPSGGVAVFVGTASSLFQLGSDGTWSNVTRSGGDYSVNAEDGWQFVTYRSRVIAVCGLGEEPQTFLLGTDTEFEDLDDVGSGTPPRAKHIGIARDFVMMGNTYDGVDGAAPSRVWWSAIGDPTSWPTPGSLTAQAVMSSFLDLVGGGPVQAVIPGLGGADVVVFGERRIWRGTFVGPPVQWDFQVVDPARGLYAPGAIATNGQIAIYLAEDGFYAFDGIQSTPIGADVVDRWFLERLDSGKLHRVSSAMDSENKLFWVAFPGAGNSGFANHLLILNWETGRWTHAQVGSGATGAEIQCLAPMRSTGFTLEALDAFGPLDQLPLSLDSRAWAGGGAYMGAITDGTLLCSFSGTTLEALVEGPEQAADNTGSQRLLVQGVRPYVDTGSAFCSIKVRNQQGEPPVQTAWTPLARDGVSYQRGNGRFVRACVRVPAGAEWTHLQGFDLVGRPAGRR